MKTKLAHSHISIKMNIKHVERTRARKYCQYLYVLVLVHCLNWINYMQHLSFDWKQTNGIPSQKWCTWNSTLIHASGMLTIMCIRKKNYHAQQCMYSNFYLHLFMLFIVILFNFQLIISIRNSFFISLFRKIIFLFESWLNIKIYIEKKKPDAFHYYPHASMHIAQQHTHRTHYTHCHLFWHL